jgi:hypothetical protein
MAMSEAVTIVKPPPKHQPLIMAMTGCGIVRISSLRQSLDKRRTSSRTLCGCESISRKYCFRS